MRKRYTAADQQRFLDELRESGQSAERVAKRLGIAKSTAYKWQQRATQSGGVNAGGTRVAASTWPWELPSTTPSRTAVRADSRAA